MLPSSALSFIGLKYFAFFASAEDAGATIRVLQRLAPGLRNHDEQPERGTSSSTLPPPSERAGKVYIRKITMMCNKLLLYSRADRIRICIMQQKYRVTSLSIAHPRHSLKKYVVCNEVRSIFFLSTAACGDSTRHRNAGDELIV